VCIIMSRRFKIVIAGAGGMGSATGLLLKELGDFEVDLFLGDSQVDRAHTAARWIQDGSERPGAVTAFHLPPDGTTAETEALLSHADILLDCLPGEQAPRMARFARDHNLHYSNLTEHVRETEEVKEIAAGAEQGYILQTGLAPGFVNVLAMALYRTFCQEHGEGLVDRIAMRVGALTPTVQEPTFYAFTWSTIGVSTEYVEPATVIRDFRRTVVPSLSERRPLVIGGVLYEEDFTSGGAADLPAAFEGKAKTLDYKTLRHPGHYAWVQSVLQEAPEGVDRSHFLLERMQQAVPTADEDLVVIYASVERTEEDGFVRRIESSRVIHPCTVGRHPLKAIQSTTSAGLAESARLLLTQGYRGVCLQSQIDPQAFMRGPFVSRIYG
jgi:saccharopine dehydrogenase-like NADP-dependent oxidoreductase